MFKKTSVNAVGGYASTRYSEDWDLIIRMLSKNMLIENISEVLVFVRGGDDMVDRRRQIPQVIAELKLFHEMNRTGYISLLQLITNATIRIVIRIFPRRVTSLIYSRILRKFKTK